MTMRATYRVQFHKGFTFADAERQIPYFAKLGISHLYASPILTARAGSMHGYDVVDPAHVNPELGGAEAFRALSKALREQGIGILLDIVPNHMAVGGADNPYWLDVLEKGRDSVFANLFDIDWEPAQPSLRDRIFVPLLGKPLREALADGEIKLVWDARLGKFAFAYFDHRFPVRLDDYETVQNGAGKPEEADLSRWTSSDELTALLARQNFRLAHWRDAGDRINWRRFFDISSLAALRVEDDAVFELVHGMILKLYGEGFIDGVRVDHIDGLADPKSYCLRLRARMEALMPQRPVSLPRERAIIVVEKILAEGEELPADWDVDGTTGYDFMNTVSAIQHDGRNERLFTDLWTSISGRSADFEIEECRARREIIESAFANALEAAARAFQTLQDGEKLPAAAALARVLEHLRAYRTYATGDSAVPQPGPFFEAALQAAIGNSNANEHAALSLIGAVMHGEYAKRGADAREAVRRFNQLAAPVAAKAVEDTALYRYGRLLSRNDVGFQPGHFAWDAREFHAANEKRQAQFPTALLATATHDHKRGEDARARLAVLSELPDEWKNKVHEWFASNAHFRGPEIAPGDEYQLYQTLVASWPLDLSRDSDTADFTKRILGWRQKSLREAKLVTSWAEPDEAVEAAHADFVRDILSRGHGFVQSLAEFVNWLAPAAVLNSLVQTTLRCTAPGVPDLYQGAELWDLSLVDPDNRHRVDFEVRGKLLNDAPVAHMQDWRRGQVKLALIARILQLRTKFPELFRGGYAALQTGNEHILAFSRRANDRALVVAVPRLVAHAAIARKMPLPQAGLALPLPPDLQHKTWRDGLRPELPEAVIASPLFREFPAAIFVSD